MLIEWADAAEHTVHLLDAIADVAAGDPTKRLYQLLRRTLKIQKRSKSNWHRFLLDVFIYASKFMYQSG